MERFSPYLNQSGRKQLAYAGMPDLSERNVAQRVLIAESIDPPYQLLRGAMPGLARHGEFWGTFKLGIRSASLRELCLGGAVPRSGPGRALALMCGWLAADDDLEKDGVAGKAQTSAAHKGSFSYLSVTKEA